MRTGAVALWTVIISLIIGTFIWGEEGNSRLTNLPGLSANRQVVGELFGSMPKPIQPKIIDRAIDPLNTARNQQVVIKRIPRISKDMAMPHPYWGDCARCHLFKGGPPAGSQWKSPVGKVLEQVSNIHKIGPPILPGSTRPHPPAGRCIKCHDIAVDVAFRG